jgi:aryl-alcohol dehydrogenase-like predicted oxidoreductase
VEQRPLGNTGIQVSRMCMGTLTMGPLQAGLSPEEGAELIVRAHSMGVTFFDTAELYDTYDHIAVALQTIPRHDIVIASRCYEYTYDGMKASIERALRAMRTDYIDVFGLHEQENSLTLAGHAEALRCAVDAKRAGVIRAVSISTHAIAAVEAARTITEIDVIHPIFNLRGIGIIDGQTEQMAEAIAAARAAGTGVYSMKPLGGGHLLKQAREAVSWVLAHQFVDSMAIGVRDVRELEADVALVEGRPVDADELAGIARDKRLFIEDWCVQCGACVEACRQGALSMGQSRPVVDYSRCVLCGYCVARCRDFCIKVL